jgi:hypothetical protein
VGSNHVNVMDDVATSVFVLAKIAAPGSATYESAFLTSKIHLLCRRFCLSQRMCHRKCYETKGRVFGSLFGTKKLIIDNSFGIRTANQGFDLSSWYVFFSL